MERGRRTTGEFRVMHARPAQHTTEPHHLAVRLVRHSRAGKPRQETSADIIRRALEICPQLAYPPIASSASDPASPTDLEKLVKSTIVGFRPTRDAGIRLEIDDKRTSAGIPVIHNYGHGGKDSP